MQHELAPFPEMEEETSDLWNEGIKDFLKKGGFAQTVKNKGVPGALDLNVLLPTFEEISKLDRHVEYVIEGAIPEESITMIHGRGGLGKSWLAQQIGNCISEGEPFCGLATKKSLVYFVDYENSLSMLCDRARILGPSSMKLWHISNSIPPPRFDSSDWILVKSLFPGVLIIDTLRSSQLGDENSSKDMALVMGRMKELRELGFTIILLHHTQKSDSRTYKGSTAILDLCDHVLGLERVKEIGSDTIVDEDESDLPFRLGTREKTRFEPFSIFLKFHPVKGFSLVNNPDDELLSNLQDLLEGGELNQTEFFKSAKDALEVNRRKFLSLLRKGEGRFWIKNKSVWKNQTVYCSVVHAENQSCDSQLLKNIELSSCPPPLGGNTGTVTTDLLEQNDEGE